MLLPEFLPPSCVLQYMSHVVASRPKSLVANPCPLVFPLRIVRSATGTPLPHEHHSLGALPSGAKDFRYLLVNMATYPSIKYRPQLPSFCAVPLVVHRSVSRAYFTRS
jgi:hypothetical protein